MNELLNLAFTISFVLLLFSALIVLLYNHMDNPFGNKPDFKSHWEVPTFFLVLTIVIAAAKLFFI